MNFKQKAYHFLRWTEKYTKADMVYLANSFFWLNFEQMASLILGVLSAVAFANFIPKEIFGHYTYVLSVMGILTITTLPNMNIAVIQSVARGFDGTLVPALKKRLEWGILGVIASLAIAGYYYLNENRDYAISFLMVAVFLVPLYSFNLYQSFLKGKKEFKSLTKINLLNQSLVTASLIVAVYLADNVFIILLAFFVPQIILNFIAFRFVKKKFTENKKEDPEAIHYGKYLNTISIIGVIGQHFDKFIVGVFLGPAELAVYAFATMLPEKIGMISNSMGVLAMPKFSTINEKTLKSYVTTKVYQSFLITIPVALLYLVAAPFIYGLIFPNYSASIFISQIIGVGLIFECNRIMITYFNAQKKKKEIFLMNTILPLFEIMIMLILLPLYEITGMAVALVLCNVFNFLFLMWLLKKS